MNRLKLKIKDLLSKGKEQLTRIKKGHLIRETFKNNTLFITFVIVNVLNSTILRFFCMQTIENFLSIKAIIADLAIVIIIGSFSHLLKQKVRFYYLFGFTIFLTAICVINSVYYTFYTSFVSVSMIVLTQYVVDVGDAVVENVLQLKDLVYLIAPIILLIANYKLKKKSDTMRVEMKSERKKRMISSLTVGGVLSIIFLITLTSLDVTRFVKQWNKEYIVMRFGIYIYQVNDVITSIQPKINSMFGYDKAKKEFDEYFENKENIHTNEYTDIFDGKNVIVIHGESMMTNAMSLSFNGQELTPNLNKLAKEGLFFSNFYSQVSVGTSSDSELTYNTSLMPTKSGTAFVSYYDRSYISIPKLLKEKGYYTFSMHANNADFWNRRAMHKSLGYDKFYAKSEYKVNKDNIIGLGLNDKSFFQQSIDKIEKINKKYSQWYGLLIMLTNHTPFSDVEKYGEYEVNIKETETNENGEITETVYPYMEGTKLGNYFKSLHYADEALGELMNGLEEKGLLENTVVILYGDHDARLPRADYNRLYNYDKTTDSVREKEDPEYKEYDTYQYELGRKVPLIIWTKNSFGTELLNKEITDVMGMYDVMPTLGNMLGFYNKYSLGHDIFEIKENNIIPFPNGNWLTNKVYYNSQKEAYLSLVEEPVSEEYIKEKNEYTNKLLDVSNNIIVFNLLNQEKEKE